MNKFVTGARRLLSDTCRAVFNPYKHEKEAYHAKWDGVGLALRQRYGLLMLNPDIGEIKDDKGNYNTCACLTIQQMTNKASACVKINEPLLPFALYPASPFLELRGLAANNFERLHAYEVSPMHKGGRKFLRTVTTQAEMMAVAGEWQKDRFGTALEIDQVADPHVTMFMGNEQRPTTDFANSQLETGLLVRLRRAMKRISETDQTTPSKPSL